MKKFSFSYLIPAIYYGGLLFWKCPLSSAIEQSDLDGSQPSPNFIPIHYDIHLQVILNNSTFSSKEKEYTVPGKVRIVGKAILPKNFTNSFEIAIHPRKLDIDPSSVSVAKLSKQENDTLIITRIPIQSVEFITKVTSPYMPSLNLFAIRLEMGNDTFIGNDSSLIEDGDELEVSMDYNGSIVDGSSNSLEDNAFVYLPYTTEEGDSRAFVRAENPDLLNRVQKMFPTIYAEEYYDDLHTFQFTVVHEQKYTCIWNTPLEFTSEVPENPDWVRDRFSKSLRMSINSLSFILSDFSFVEAQFGNNKSVRVYAPEHILRGANYTVNVAAKMLSFLDDYLMDYFSESVQKLDIVWGGDKNKNLSDKLSWGLYIDASNNLFKFSSPQSREFPPKEFLPELLAFPLTHQYLALHHTYWSHKEFLEWKVIQNATLEGLISEERLDDKIACDRSETLFRITVPESNSGFIRKFGVQCNTWSSKWRVPDWDYKSHLDFMILSTMENALTPKLFQPQFLSYMANFYADKRKWFGAPSPWGPERYKILCNFLNTSNMNLIHASNIFNASSFDDLQNTSWYYSSFPVVQIWTFNEKYANISETEISHESTFVSLEIEERVDWANNDCDFTRNLIVPVNRSEFLKGGNNTGYFRIMYDPVLLNDILLMLESANFGGITPIKRAQLFDDYFVFAFETNRQNGVLNGSGHYDRNAIIALLKLTRYLDSETSIAVWNIVLTNLQYFEIALGSHPEYPKIQNYFRQKLESALKTFGFEVVKNASSFYEYSDLFTVSDDNLWSLVNLRGNLLYWACKMGNKICAKIGHQFYEMWKNSNGTDSFPSSLVRYQLISSVVLGVGSEDALKFCFEKVNLAPEDLRSVKDWKDDLLRALTQTSNLNILRMVLNSTSNSHPSLLCLLAKNPAGREIAFYFLKAILLKGNTKELYQLSKMTLQCFSLSQDKFKEIVLILEKYKHLMDDYLYSL